MPSLRDSGRWEIWMFGRMTNMEYSSTIERVPTIGENMCMQCVVCTAPAWLRLDRISAPDRDPRTEKDEIYKGSAALHPTHNRFRFHIVHCVLSVVLLYI